MGPLVTMNYFFGRFRLCVFSVFFCVGELTVQTPTSFNPVVHLAWEDVSISADGQVLRIFLKRSKTDQYGRGVKVFIRRTGNLLCPVEAVRIYVERRGSAAGAFFCSAGGLPLSKSHFVEQVRSALTRAGISTEKYSGHSFWIGAATAAAEAGVPDSTIQALGRWTYIRTPRERLSNWSSSMARV